MASVSKDSSGNVRIQFMMDGVRKSVRVGSVSMKAAASIRLKIETILASRLAGVPLDYETAAWVGQIGDELAEKLASTGLIPARPKTLTLGGLLDLYANEKEADNKPGTRTNHNTITNDLVGHFGNDAALKTITHQQAKGFLDHLKGRGLASATVGRRIRRCRSIFAFAVKRGLIPANPFGEVKAMSVLPQERKAYVPLEDLGKLMEAASPVWRTILALCRYAGLRCPSEVLSLKWSDINFVTGRMCVPSPKTEGIPGKEYRICPIFAELRPHLEYAHELANPGEIYVVSGRMADRARIASEGPNGWVSVNLRQEFMRLVKRAGLKTWPRLFHTLRASAETDLMERFPMNAVTEWLGHSAAVALKHYARVPDHLFEQAANAGAKSGSLPVQNPVQTGADTNRQERIRMAEGVTGVPFSPVLSSPALSRPNESVTLRGFEAEDANTLPIKHFGKVDSGTGAKSGSPVREPETDTIGHDADLTELVALWPTLPTEVRDAILSVARESIGHYPER